MSAALQAACKQAWQDLLARFAPQCPAFRAAARALATLDALQSLANQAQVADWCRPAFVEAGAAGARLSIRGGRAPLLDALLPQGAVPNDTELGGQDGLRMLVVSGPNMGGKSSYMCQVCIRRSRC